MKKKAAQKRQHDPLLTLRTTIVDAAHHAKEGHIPSALSILDILWVLYDKVLNIYPKKPNHPGRDFFILSKGHASLGLYAVLAEKGFFSKKEFDTFCSFESMLGGHPHRICVPGVETSTGSLGHGMPMAIGVALGLKILRKTQKVFVLIGDGEANEGTIWESALLASHHKLDNVCCIVDYNHSTDRALSVGNLEEKFASFGWQTASVDGHDRKKLERVMKKKHPHRPFAVIANTVKGKGVSIMEGNPAWHHKVPSKEERDAIMAALNTV